MFKVQWKSKPLQLSHFETVYQIERKIVKDEKDSQKEITEFLIFDGSWRWVNADEFILEHPTWSN